MATGTWAMLERRCTVATERSTLFCRRLGRWSFGATNRPNLTEPRQPRIAFRAYRPLIGSILEGSEGAIWEKALGPEHPSTAMSLNNLAVLLQYQGDLAGARPLYQPGAGDPGEGARPRAPEHRSNETKSGAPAIGDRPSAGGARTGRSRAGGPREISRAEASMDPRLRSRRRRRAQSSPPRR